MEKQPLPSREALDIEFGQYFDLLGRKWLLLALIWGGTFALFSAAAFSRAPSYEASSKVLVKVDRTSSLTGIGKGVGEIDALVNAQNPLSTEVEIILSSPMLERVIGTLDLVDQEGAMLRPKDFREELSVKIVGGADVIQLGYEADDPQLVADVANELSQAYIESNILANQLQASKARLLIEQQLPESERFVRESEAALRQFKEANQIVSLSDEAKSVVQALQELNSQLLTYQTSLDEVTSQSEQLSQMLGLDLAEAMVASDLSQSKAVQDLLRELQVLEREKAKALGTYTDASPVIQTASAEEAFLKQLLQQEIAAVAGRRSVPESYLQMGETRQALIAQYSAVEVQRLGLVNRLETLEEYRSRYRARATSLPSLEQQQTELERTQEVARQSYQENLRRLRDLEVAEDQSIGNASLLEAAVVPDEPNRSFQLMLMGFGGLLGSVLAAATAAMMAFSESRDSRRQAQAGLYVPPSLKPKPGLARRSQAQNSTGSEGTTLV